MWSRTTSRLFPTTAGLAATKIYGTDAHNIKFLKYAIGGLIYYYGIICYVYIQPDAGA
jgi:hypothetical protein